MSTIPQPARAVNDIMRSSLGLSSLGLSNATGSLAKNLLTALMLCSNTANRIDIPVRAAKSCDLDGTNYR